MSQLALMITRIDDLDSPNTLTEVWRQTMPVVDPTSIMPEYYLDGLETAVTDIGWEAMRALMVEQWRLTDQVLVSRFRQEQTGTTTGDGYDPLKVVSRLITFPSPHAATGAGDSSTLYFCSSSWRNCAVYNR